MTRENISLRLMGICGEQYNNSKLALHRAAAARGGGVSGGDSTGSSIARTWEHYGEWFMSCHWFQQSRTGSICCISGFASHAVWCCLYTAGVLKGLLGTPLLVLARWCFSSGFSQFSQNLKLFSIHRNSPCFQSAGIGLELMWSLRL